jgi:hypothetical protein
VLDFFMDGLLRGSVGLGLVGGGEVMIRPH